MTSDGVKLMVGAGSSTELPVLLKFFQPALVPSIWLLFFTIIFLIFYREIKRLLNVLVLRLRSGDGVKLGAFELTSTRIYQNGSAASPQHVKVDVGSFGELQAHRLQAYSKCNRIMLVHKIFKSVESGQLFDIEVYCIPHKDASITSVISVEYCFGDFWDGKTYKTTNRSNCFMVTTNAYGETLCVAKISFNDGSEAIVSRYLDFEMGPYSVCLETKDVK